MQPEDAFSPYNWATLLKTVVESRETGSYLDIAVTREGHHYVLIDPKDLLNPAIRKLSIAEIVKLSCRCLFMAYADFEAKNQHYTTQVLDDLYHQITAYVLRLLDLRENKKRGIMAWAASWISLKQDAEIKRETEELRLQMTSLGAFPITQLALQARLDKFPGVVSVTLRDMNQADIVQFITYHVNRYIQEKEANPQIPCVTAFRQDIERGLAFIRRDKSRGIYDSSFWPRQETPTSQRLDEAVDALAEITDNDSWWEAVLQTLATQTSRTALFDCFKAHYVDQIQRHTWLENQVNYGLVFEFSPVPQPITLEIKRNADNRISEVTVEVYGIGDLLKVDLGRYNGHREIVFSNILNGTMRYTLFCTEEGRSSIKDLTYNLECFLGIHQLHPNAKL